MFKFCHNTCVAFKQSCQVFTLYCKAAAIERREPASVLRISASDQLVRHFATINNSFINHVVVLGVTQYIAVSAYSVRGKHHMLPTSVDLYQTVRLHITKVYCSY
jgi:hypothetical protein